MSLENNSQRIWSHRYLSMLFSCIFYDAAWLKPAWQREIQLYNNMGLNRRKQSKERNSK